MAEFYNQATLTYNGGTATSNITVGELVDTLTVTKTPLIGCYHVGDTLTYIVSLVNAGQRPFRDLRIKDDLGAYEFEGTKRVPLTYIEGSLKYYVDGVLQEEPNVEAGPPLKITDIDVPADGNALLIYAVRVNAYAPPYEGAEIENTVKVRRERRRHSCGCPENGITATATVTADCDPGLTISKSLYPTAVNECDGELTYTFLIQNSGNTAAGAEAMAAVTDTFDPALSDLAVTFNGETWTEPGNYTYNENTGVFTTVAGQITVPAATFTQDTDTGLWTTTPGVSTLTVTGNV